MPTQEVFSLAGHTFSVSILQLLVASAVLLAAAAFLLLLSRKNRVVVQRSLLTDEMMLHLSRIADALERQAMQSSARVIETAHPRSEGPLQPALSAEAHTIPYSMFGREIHPGR